MHVQLFVHMCDSGVQADAVTCCSLINAMDKAGMWQVAEVLLLAMDATSPALAPLRALPAPQFSPLVPEEAAVVDSLRSRLALGSFEVATGVALYIAWSNCSLYIQCDFSHAPQSAHHSHNSNLCHAGRLPLVQYCRTTK